LASCTALFFKIMSLAPLTGMIWASFFLPTLSLQAIFPRSLSLPPLRSSFGPCLDELRPLFPDHGSSNNSPALRLPADWPTARRIGFSPSLSEGFESRRCRFPVLSGRHQCRLFLTDDGITLSEVFCILRQGHEMALIAEFVQDTRVLFSFSSRYEPPSTGVSFLPTLFRCQPLATTEGESVAPSSFTMYSIPCIASDARKAFPMPAIAQKSSECTYKPSFF